MFSLFLLFRKDKRAAVVIEKETSGRLSYTQRLAAKNRQLANKQRTEKRERGRSVPDFDLWGGGWISEKFYINRKKDFHALRSEVIEQAVSYNFLLSSWVTDRLASIVMLIRGDPQDRFSVHNKRSFFETIHEQ